MSITTLVTAEDLLAMGSDAMFELIEGELVDVSPSFGRSSEISLNIVEIIRPHVRRFKLGYVTGEAGGYLINRNPDTVVIPDVGFISTSKLPTGLPENEFIPFPPELAVEVMSTSDRLSVLERKVERYLAAGTDMVWLVRPTTKEVLVYSPGSEMRAYRSPDQFILSSVLPGLSIETSSIFE